MMRYIAFTHPVGLFGRIEEDEYVEVWDWHRAAFRAVTAGLSKLARAAA
jgi:hypothetical protein